jgi:hypothetical protein
VQYFLRFLERLSKYSIDLNLSIHRPKELNELKNHIKILRKSAKEMDGETAQTLDIEVKNLKKSLALYHWVYALRVVMSEVERKKKEWSWGYMKRHRVNCRR